MPVSTDSGILYQSIYSAIIFDSKAEFYLSGTYYSVLLSTLVTKIRLRWKCVPVSTDSGILCHSIYYSIIFASNAEAYLSGALYCVLLSALFTKIRLRWK